MCGISGIIHLDFKPVGQLELKLRLQSKLIAHRGPDGQGIWTNDKNTVGFSHRRLSIIDLSNNGKQPMIGNDGNVLTYNGEIYNYKDLRQNLSNSWQFKSNSDTECILAAYAKHGYECLGQFRGMYSFAVWDNKRNRLF